jgi:hypothetical protein
MKDFRRGVALVAFSWGWDVEKGLSITQPKNGQEWRGYEVRLRKMADSLFLLGEEELFRSMQTFAKQCTINPIKEKWVLENLKLK